MYQNKFDKVCRASEGAGEKNDCAVKALAIVCRCSYSKALAACMAAGREPRKGTPLSVINVAMWHLGYDYNSKYTRGSYSRHVNLGPISRVAPTLERGYYLVFTRGHVAAVHNGEIHDWTKGRKHHVRMIGKVEKIIK